LGVIGAFLAHRALLEHIAQTAPDKSGTLIFEDDVQIPTDFYAKLKEVEAEVPADWDILFLDKYRVESTPIRSGSRIHALPRDMTAKKNWGIWAYIVKNSSVGPKILPTMEHMLDVPDIQLNKFAHKLKMYLVQPPLVELDRATATTSVVSILDRQKA
jgi:GR25 family glycosyltransferase involved in LPS biosynthesis